MAEMTKANVAAMDLNGGQTVVTRGASLIRCFDIEKKVAVFLYDHAHIVAGGACVDLSEHEVVNEENARPLHSLNDLINLMYQFGGETVKISAKLVGGSFADSPEVNYLALKNARMAKEILIRHRVTIEREDLGGKESRTALFRFPESKVEIRTSGNRKYWI